MLVLAETGAGNGRWRRWREEAVETRVLGLRAVVLRVPEGPERRKRRQTERCRRFLRERPGGAELCFREGFWLEEALGESFPVADRRALVEAKAVEIVRRAGEGRERVLFCAGVCTRETLEAFRRLCRTYRYLTAEGPPHVLERLEREAERYGVSLTGVRREGTVEADAAVLFAPPERRLTVEPECAVLCTSGKPGTWLPGGRVVEAGFR